MFYLLCCAFFLSHSNHMSMYFDFSEPLFVLGAAELSGSFGLVGDRLHCGLG